MFVWVGGWVCACGWVGVCACVRVCVCGGVGMCVCVGVCVGGVALYVYVGGWVDVDGYGCGLGRLVDWCVCGWVWACGWGRVMWRACVTNPHNRGVCVCFVCALCMSCNRYYRVCLFSPQPPY